MSGVLRGFDPFMNLVIDESVEETKVGEKRSIGMVVSFTPFNQNKIEVIALYQGTRE